MKNKFDFKPDLLACAVAIILAGISFFTDHIIFKEECFSGGDYIRLKLIYALILIVLGQALALLIKSAKKNAEIKRAILFAGVCCGVLLFFLLLTYPGIWIWDNMEMLNMASHMEMSAWHGYYMQCFFVFSLMLIPLPVGINIIQIVLIAAIMGRIYYIVSGNITNKKITWILLLFLLLPGNLYWALMAYRTAFFGFLCSLSVMEFLNFWKKGKVNFFYIILLYGFVWNIRSEGYALLLLIPAVSYRLYKNKEYKKALLFLAGALLTVKVVSAPVPGDRMYFASAIMNPLQCMMKSELISDNLQSDMERIDKVFSVETLHNSQASPLAVNMEGSAWCAEGFFDNIYCPQKEWNDMLKAYCNLVYFNPQLFVKYRLRTMLHSVIINKSSFGEIAALVNGAEGKFEFDSYYGTKPISENMRQIVKKIIGFEYAGALRNKLGVLLGSAVFPILFLIILLIYSIKAKRKELLIISGTMLLLMGIVFISAPAANPMYYYSIYNSMWLFLVIKILMLLDSWGGT